MTNLNNSPFLLKSGESYKMVDANKVYIRSLNSINTYKSMATDTPYQASFDAVLHSEEGLCPKQITILYCDMPEAIKLLNDQHKYLAARTVETAYFIIQNQINFENQIYD